MLDPGGGVFLQCRDAFVDTAPGELVGEVSEPAFDLVEPGRPGRGEVDVEAGVPGEPVVDYRGFVGGEVVADQVDIEFGGHGLVDLTRNLRSPGGGGGVRR